MQTSFAFTAWQSASLLHDGWQTLSIQAWLAPHCALVTHALLSTGLGAQRWFWQVRPVPQLASLVQAFWHSPSMQAPPVPHSRLNTQWLGGTGACLHRPFRHSLPEPQSD
jgi:hypothetical protein